MPTLWGLMGKHKDQPEAEEAGEMGARAFTVVSAGKNRQGRVSSLGIGTSNNFIRLQGIGAAPRVLLR